MVERLICNQEVIGSNPIGSTNVFPPFCGPYCMESLKIGISGVAGSFSEEAALKYLEKQSLTGELVYLVSAENVLSAVEKGEVDYGIVPVENSTGGVVIETIYALSQHTCKIQELFNIEVIQNLLVHPEAKLADITEIVSHDQALKQCRMTLKREYPNMELREYADTAKAAEDLAKGTLPKTSAVIASANAAKLYGLTVAAPAIQDLKYNFTTFFAATQE